MHNVTGSVARGDDFFDRMQEMSDFWCDLESDNLLLLAARRVGKTSLMQRMACDSGDRGFTTVFIDVSDCANEMGLIQRLCTTILDTAHGETVWRRFETSWVSRVAHRVQKIGGGGFTLEFSAENSTWNRLGEELAAALANLDGRWLIQIDELPVFVLKLLNESGALGRARVREFLYWLRRLRQQHPSIRWMLAGSIGLDTVTSRLEIADSINDLRIVHLDAFALATALRFLAALSDAHELGLTPEVSRHIVHRAGWPVPYYLQLIFHELRGMEKPIGMGHVDESIERLLKPQNRNYFDYWRQRLPEELGSPDAAHASLILSHCSRTVEGSTRSALSLALSTSIPDAVARENFLRYLLDVLQNDGYVVDTQSRLRFRSPLLREYWLRRVAPPEESDGR